MISANRASSALVITAFLLAAFFDRSAASSMEIYSGSKAHKALVFISGPGDVPADSKTFDTFYEVPTGGLALRSLLAPAFGLNRDFSSLAAGTIFAAAFRIDSLFHSGRMRRIAFSAFESLGYSLITADAPGMDSLGRLFPGTYALLGFRSSAPRERRIILAATLEDFTRLVLQGEAPGPKGSTIDQFNFTKLDLSNYPALSPPLGLPGLYGSGDTAGFGAREAGALSFLYPTRFGQRWAFCLNREPAIRCGHDLKAFSPDDRKIFIRLREKTLSAPGPRSVLPSAKLVELLEFIRKKPDFHPDTADTNWIGSQGLEPKSIIALELLNKCGLKSLNESEHSLLRSLTLKNTLFYWSFDSTLPAQVEACAKKMGDQGLESYGGFLSRKLKFERGTVLSELEFLKALTGVERGWHSDGQIPANWYSDAAFFLSADQQSFLRKGLMSIPGISEGETSSSRAADALLLVMLIRARHSCSTPSITLSAQLFQNPEYLNPSEKDWVKLQLGRLSGPCEIDTKLD